MSPLGTTVGAGVGQAKHSIPPSSAALPLQAPEKPGTKRLGFRLWLAPPPAVGPLNSLPGLCTALVLGTPPCSGPQAPARSWGKGRAVCVRRAPRARAGPLAPRCKSSAETRRGGKKSERGSARRPRPGVPATSAPKTCGRSRLGRTGRGFPRKSGRGCVDAVLHQP